MRRSLLIFLSIAMILVALFGVLDLGNAESDVKVASAADMGTDTNATTYTVKKGDSLHLIAQGYGTTVSTLKANNGLTSDVILPGQELVISKQPTGEIKIVIEKTHQKLAIYRGDTEIKIYEAQFGEGGMGDK